MASGVEGTKGYSEKWAEVGDLSVRYLDWGGDGPTVLALHGLASSANWYDLVSPLLQNNYRVIAPDQRGHGRTTQARSGYDWQTLSSDAVGLLDQLGIQRAAVLGHSWGGNVAINVAADAPGRTDALVMIDGGTFGARRTSSQSWTWEQFKSRAAPRDVSGTREEFLERMSRQLSICWNIEVARVVQTMVWEDDHGQMHDILRPDNHAQVLMAMWDHPASDTWPNIKCPTLIIPAGPLPERADSEFAVFKREGVMAASLAIPKNRVRWIPETIHDIGFHKPRELAQVIDEFLAEVLPKA